MPINPVAGNAVQQALFKKNDANKSGTLTGAEFKQALADVTGKSVGKITTTEVKAALNQLDADGDKKISVQEFEQANVAAAQSLSARGPNIYQALQSAGIAQSNTGSNVYGQLLSGSLNGSFTSTGSLVGQIVAGSVLKVSA